MKTLLKLLRIQQIIIIALSMFIFRYFMLEPVLNFYGLKLSMPGFEFVLLVISVMMLTIGAGIINDYFDRKSDLHNYPSNVVFSVNINRRYAILFHSLFSFLGVIIGWYVSYMAGFFWFGLFFIFVSAMIWFYSSYFKRQMLSGNIIVSLMVAGIPFIVFAFEYFFAVKIYGENEYPDIMHHLLILTSGFSVAAFLTFMAHEITDDIIDFRGDYESGSQTLPIKMGKQAARSIVSLLLLLFIIFIVFAWICYIRDLPYMEHPLYSVIYISALIIIPSILMSLRIYNLKKIKQLKAYLTLLKLMMLAGILYTILIYFNIQI